MASNIAFAFTRALRRLQQRVELKLAAYNHFKNILQLVLLSMQQILAFCLISTQITVTLVKYIYIKTAKL